MRTISVVVPIYHGKQYIGSILNQMETCRQCLEEEDFLEVIFVNDAPDDPIALCKDSESVHVIVINTGDNVGIHGARMKGLKRSSGEYILFLDQDDCIKPDYFSSQLSAVGESDAVVCQAIHEKRKFYADQDSFRKMICKEFIMGEWNAIISPGQVLLRRKSIPVSWVKNRIKNNGGDDWFLWLCMFAEQCKFALNQDILYEHILHGQNYSADLVKMLQTEQEVIRVVKEQGILSEEDFLLLLDGFFKRNINRMHQLNVLKRKWSVLEDWKRLSEKQVKLSDYLIQNRIRKVAIYGCGLLGEEVYNSLKNELMVTCFIDRNACELKKEIPVYSLQDKLPEVDGVIITLIDEAKKVEREIRKRFSGEILILEDWLMYV